MKIFQNKIEIGVFIIFIIISFSFFLNNFEKGDYKDKMVQHVEAATERDISGFAWSDNIGWISFSCVDLGTCTSVNYGVKVNSDNELTGYAWSDNIGWITFNESELSGCPEGACKAKLVGNSLTGWAKALSAEGNGWDGWISLNKKDSDSVDYGINLGGTDFNGFAWGSEVLGWISFNPSASSGVVLDTTSDLAIKTFGISPVTNGNKPTISWTTENAERCEGSWASEDICTGVDNCASGSDLGEPVLSQTTYTITCYNGEKNVSKSETPASFYDLKYLSGYDDEVEVSFVATGSTTTKTKVGVIPWNGYVSDVVLDVLIDSATPESLPSESYPIYSDQTLSSTEYDDGSEISIYVSELITDPRQVSISGNGTIRDELILKINAGKKIKPIFQEI